MISENSKPHVLILNFTYRIDLRRGEKSIALSNHSVCYIWKSIKSLNTTTVNLKFQLQHGTINLNYQMDYILCQIFKIILSILKKNHGEKIDNPSRRIYIYISKVKNRTTFKIKIGYYLKLLTLETMKLLGTTENRITKDKKLWNYRSNVSPL